MENLYLVVAVGLGWGLSVVSDKLYYLYYKTVQNEEKRAEEVEKTIINATKRFEKLEAKFQAGVDGILEELANQSAKLTTSVKTGTVFRDGYQTFAQLTNDGEDENVAKAKEYLEKYRQKFSASKAVPVKGLKRPKNANDMEDEVRVGKYAVAQPKVIHPIDAEWIADQEQKEEPLFTSYRSSYESQGSVSVMNPTDSYESTLSKGATSRIKC